MVTRTAFLVRRFWQAEMRLRMPTEMKDTPKQTGMCHSRVSVAIW